MIVVTKMLYGHPVSRLQYSHATLQLTWRVKTEIADKRFLAVMRVIKLYLFRYAYDDG
jgi:hypothetical protein